MPRPRVPAQDVTDLDRNDVPAAIDLWRRRVADGTWDPSSARVLIMLQDDPAELFAAMKADELARSLVTDP